MGLRSRTASARRRSGATSFDRPTTQQFYAPDRPRRKTMRRNWDAAEARGDAARMQRGCGGDTVGMSDHSMGHSVGQRAAGPPASHSDAGPGAVRIKPSYGRRPPITRSVLAASTPFVDDEFAPPESDCPTVRTAGVSLPSCCCPPPDPPRPGHRRPGRSTRSHRRSRGPRTARDQLPSTVASTRRRGRPPPPSPPSRRPNRGKGPPPPSAPRCACCTTRTPSTSAHVCTTRLAGVVCGPGSSVAISRSTSTTPAPRSSPPTSSRSSSTPTTIT